MFNRVRVRLAAVKALDRDRDVLQTLQAPADAAAAMMARRAPKDTGGGARSIHAELDPGLPGWRVGWDKAHFYLSFAELGTEHQPARPFARPVADEINRARS